MATWMTFLPCFYFVLCGASAVDRLRHNGHIQAALKGITCAVVGVIASLGLDVALAAFWPAGHADPVAWGIGALATFALGSGRVPTLVALVAAAALGALRARIH